MFRALLSSQEKGDEVMLIPWVQCGLGDRFIPPVKAKAGVKITAVFHRNFSGSTNTGCIFAAANYRIYIWNDNDGGRYSAYGTSASNWLSKYQPIDHRWHRVSCSKEGYIVDGEKISTNREFDSATDHGGPEHPISFGKGNGLSNNKYPLPTIANTSSSYGTVASSQFMYKEIVIEQDGKIVFHGLSAIKGGRCGFFDLVTRRIYFFEKTLDMTGYSIPPSSGDNVDRPWNYIKPFPLGLGIVGTNATSIQYLRTDIGSYAPYKTPWRIRLRLSTSHRLKYNNPPKEGALIGLTTAGNSISSFGGEHILYKSGSNVLLDPDGNPLRWTWPNNVLEPRNTPKEADLEYIPSDKEDGTGILKLSSGDWEQTYPVTWDIESSWYSSMSNSKYFYGFGGETQYSNGYIDGTTIGDPDLDYKMAHVVLGAFEPKTGVLLDDELSTFNTRRGTAQHHRNAHRLFDINELGIQNDNYYPWKLRYYDYLETTDEVSIFSGPEGMTERIRICVDRGENSSDVILRNNHTLWNIYGDRIKTLSTNHMYSERYWDTGESIYRLKLEWLPNTKTLRIMKNDIWYEELIPNIDLESTVDSDKYAVKLGKGYKLRFFQYGNNIGIPASREYDETGETESGIWYPDLDKFFVISSGVVPGNIVNYNYNFFNV